MYSIFEMFYYYLAHLYLFSLRVYCRPVATAARSALTLSNSLAAAEFMNIYSSCLACKNEEWKTER